MLTGEPILNGREMLTGEPILKWLPEDFVVVEVAARPLRSERAAYRYVRLVKRGVSTFAAVEALAEWSQRPTTIFAYAGLKDEDAVTEQFLAFPSDISFSLEGFNEKYRGSIQLTDAGYGDDPLAIGQLDGNSFRLVLRNLTTGMAEQISARRHNLWFTNYYDTQRFGVPEGPRVAHRIGEALISECCEDAFELVRESGSAEGARALAWHDTASAFFDSLDPRALSLYYNAASSAVFNKELAQLVTANTRTTRTVRRDGLEYTFAEDPRSAVPLAFATPELAYDKYRPGPDGSIKKTSSSRPTVVQTQVEASAAVRDDQGVGGYACALSFFLPGGCYATMAVAHLIASLGRAR